MEAKMQQKQSIIILCCCSLRVANCTFPFTVNYNNDKRNVQLPNPKKIQAISCNYHVKGIILKILAWYSIPHYSWVGQSQQLRSRQLSNKTMSAIIPFDLRTSLIRRCHTYLHHHSSEHSNRIQIHFSLLIRTRSKRAENTIQSANTNMSLAHCLQEAGFK